MLGNSEEDLICSLADFAYMMGENKPLPQIKIKTRLSEFFLNVILPCRFTNTFAKSACFCCGASSIILRPAI